MSHGYVPQSLIETTIVPIIKNKAGDLSSGNNYRPIALANVISKVFESLILLRCVQFLTTAIINLVLSRDTALISAFIH